MQLRCIWQLSRFRVNTWADLPRCNQGRTERKNTCGGSKMCGLMFGVFALLVFRLLAFPHLWLAHLPRSQPTLLWSDPVGVFTHKHINSLLLFNLIVELLFIICWFYHSGSTVCTRAYEVITNLKPFINSNWSFWRCILSPPPLKNRNTLVADGSSGMFSQKDGSSHQETW